MNIDKAVQDAQHQAATILEEVGKFEAAADHAHQEISDALSQVEARLKDVEAHDNQFQSAIDAHESEVTHAADHLSQETQTFQHQVDEVFHALTAQAEQQLQAIQALDAQIHQMGEHLMPVLDSLDHEMQTQEASVAELGKRMDAALEQKSSHISGDVVQALSTTEQHLQSSIDDNTHKFVDSTSSELEHQWSALSPELQQWPQQVEAEMTATAQTLQQHTDEVFKQLEAQLDHLLGQIEADTTQIETAIHAVLQTIKDLSSMVHDFESILGEGEKTSLSAVQMVENILENLKTLFERVLH